MLVFSLVLGVIAGLAGALAHERSRPRALHLEPMEFVTLDLRTADRETVDLRTGDLRIGRTDEAVRD